MKRLLWLSCLLVSCGVPISLDPNQNPKPAEDLGTIARALPPLPAATPLAGPSETAIVPTAAPAGPDSLPAASPEPAPSQDPSVSAPTTLNGHLYDDSGQPVDGAVSLRSVSGPVFAASTDSRGGVYVVNAVPAGVGIEISVVSPGYGRVSRVVVLKSNRPGAPAANLVDFGGSGEGRLYALSRGPRLTSLSPATETRFEAGDPLRFALHFDRPVDTKSVEAALLVNTNAAVTLPGLSLAAGETLLNPGSLAFDWNTARTNVSVGLPELPGLDRSWKLWLQFVAPISSADGYATAVRGPDGTVLGPIWISGVPQDRHALLLEAENRKLRLDELNGSATGVKLRFNKPVEFKLGSSKASVHAVGLDDPAHYALRIDADGSGAYAAEVPAQAARLADHELVLTFGNLGAYAGRNAKLVFLAGYVPRDLAGQTLENAISPLFSL